MYNVITIIMIIIWCVYFIVIPIIIVYITITRYSSVYCYLCIIIAVVVSWRPCAISLLDW